MITVTKKFEFEAAHHLEDYNGPCANVHGHSYKLWITVSSAKEDEEEDFVVDFKELKRIVKTHIIDKWDHKDLNKILVCNPTAENMVKAIRNILQPELFVYHYLQLEAVRLYETEDSYAEWRRVACY